MSSSILRPVDVTNELTSLPKRACDRCRGRKQRCNGLQPCANCSKFGAVCCYRSRPQRRGRRQRASGSTPSFIINNLPTEGHNAMDEETHQHEDGDELRADSVLTTVCGSIPFAPVIREHSTTDVSASYPSTLECVDVPAPIDDGTHLDPDDDRTAPAGHHHLLPLSAPGIGDRALLNKQPNKSPLARVGSLTSPLSRSNFLPYLQLFFDRLYPIFPVLDKQTFLNTFLVEEALQSPIPPQEYCLLAALSAAVIAQLNLSDSVAPLVVPEDLDADPYSQFESNLTDTVPSADFFVSECLRSRQEWPFVESADDRTILTSFFLFAYYGNQNQPRSAWYYLREATGFALSLGLDYAASYEGLNQVEAQLRKRLYWLLFITERAYALQHRSSVVLGSSIDLPCIFESENPRLMYGFVTLVNVFKSVDNNFVALWKGETSATITPLPEEFGTHPLEVLELDETQHMDIMVTRQWLRVLSWQIQHCGPSKAGNATAHGLSKTAYSGKGQLRSLYPFAIARAMLGIVSTGERELLESHGIGIEQKIFDVAGCLADVLASSIDLVAIQFSDGHNMLHGFMLLLANFRNRESPYLQPLLSKAATILSAGLSAPTQLAITLEEESQQDRS